MSADDDTIEIKKAALYDVVRYMIKTSILYQRPDGWWLATIGDVKMRPAPRFIARYADNLRAHPEGLNTHMEAGE